MSAANRVSRALFTLLFVFGVAGCDPAIPYVFRNGLEVPIEVWFEFEDDVIRGGEVPPGIGISVIHPPQKVQGVVIRAEGKELHRLDRRALIDLHKWSAERRNGGLWIVERDQIRAK